MTRLTVGLCILALLMTACSLPQAVQWWHLASEYSYPTPIAGDARRGEQIFLTGYNDAPPCISCHQVTTDGYGLSLGPNLADVKARGATRKEDTSAVDYLTESILDPQAYIVPGYHVSMYADYATHFSAADVADLVAYLLTL